MQFQQGCKSSGLSLGSRPQGAECAFPGSEPTFENDRNQRLGIWGLRFSALGPCSSPAPRLIWPRTADREASPFLASPDHDRSGGLGKRPAQGWIREPAVAGNRPDSPSSPQIRPRAGALPSPRVCPGAHPLVFSLKHTSGPGVLPRRWEVRPGAAGSVPWWERGRPHASAVLSQRVPSSPGAQKARATPRPTPRNRPGSTPG